MIESLRAPSATGPSVYDPPLSGPRCVSARSISSSRPFVVPQIPHMQGTLFAAAGRGREGSGGGLSMDAAPHEARLPAREAGLVDELEVEERTHVRLARCERDRGA